MSWVERLLRRLLPHKEIGWYEIGERFTRYVVFKSRLLNVYLHQLSCPNPHPHCHDHPWSFVTVLLKGGYLELIGTSDFVRRPGQVLYRRAEHLHSVTTPYGTSWSLVFTGPRGRDWGFKPCKVSK